MAMPIDEQELRSRLAETAALAGPPRFTAEGLAGRVRRSRRRRRRGAGIVAAVAVAAVAAAVAIPLTRGGTGQPVISRPAPQPSGPSYTVTANGQTRSVSANGGALPLFTVTPGERLTVTVEVRVPGPRPVSALWLGITNGVLNGHANMEPVLAASTRVPLRPGVHRFVLHWAVPAGLRAGSSRQLSTQWAWPRPEPGNAEGEVAAFAVPLPSRATSPAAVAGRLRTLALRSVASCGGGGPDWIRAVRSTYGKATAAVGGGGQVTESASAAVYLVVMKGDFILSDGAPVPPCGQAPAGHYFSAIVDAGTFTTLEAGLGNRPPAAALQTLGPVLNLTS